MTESQFIEQNKEKWRELEILLQLPQKDADKLQELFVKVSSDLSYARTFYPKRSVRLYLNNLTQKVFDSMGKKKSGFSHQNLIRFFGTILPEEAFRQRKILLVSFLIFAISFGIGALSSANNPEFAEIILGQRYIDMTNQNINEGDPMAVYKDKDAIGMFAGITVNNIQVAFLAFVLGLLGGIGTVYILVYNGIMVGVFQYFFYAKGLFLTSFLTIWIHGTIEISAIIIAGAAGIILGNGLLFPGTYKRSTSMQISAKRSLRILLGTVPLFIIAGLLESFVTRLTDLPTFVKALIIGFSLLFILVMYVIYPYYYNKKISSLGIHSKTKVQQEEELSYTRFDYRTFGENLSLSFAQFRAFQGINFAKIMVPSVLVMAFISYFYALPYTADTNIGVYAGNLFGSTKSIEIRDFLIPLLNALFITLSICYMELFMKNKGNHVHGIMSFIKQHFIYIFLIIASYSIATIFLEYWAFLILLFLPLQIIHALVDYKVENQKLGTNKIGYNLGISFRHYFHFLLPTLIAIITTAVLSILFMTFFVRILTEIIQWHNLFDNYYATNIFTGNIFQTIMITFMIPLVYFLYSNSYYSFKCRAEAIDLHLRLSQFGESKKVFE